jgi:hypothetical protein
MPVPPIVSEGFLALVQANPDTNQQTALRNTRHKYMLSAGQLRCGADPRAPAARLGADYRYYLSSGRTRW